MAKKTKVDAVKDFVKNTPGASFWVDEVVIRGRPGANGGIISGAHVVVGVESPNPAGDMGRQLLGPFPLDVLPTGAIRSVLDDVIVAQQSKIDGHREEVAAVTASRDALQQKLAAAEALATDSANKYKTLEQTTLELQAENKRLLADVQRLTTENATLTQEKKNA